MELHVDPMCGVGHLVAPKTGTSPDRSSTHTKERCSVYLKHGKEIRATPAGFCLMLIPVLGSSSKSHLWTLCVVGAEHWIWKAATNSSVAWNKGTEFFLLHLHQFKRLKKEILKFVMNLQGQQILGTSKYCLVSLCGWVFQELYSERIYIRKPPLYLY